MTEISRRRLLAGSALLATGLAGGFRLPRAWSGNVLGTRDPRMPRIGEGGVVPVARPVRGLLLGPGTSLRPDGSPDFYVSVIDLDAPAGPEYPLHWIALPFFGHGIVPDPVHPERAAVFQKMGKGACEIDLRAGRLLRVISTADNRHFYGHGAYSPDGSLLYCTESVIDGSYRGLIAVRDTKTHEELGEFPTFGVAPHDCWLIDGGRTMVVTNGGGPLNGEPPSVTYVDVQSRKLQEKLELTAPRINAGHLALSPAGDLAVVSAQREGLDPATSTGGISLRPAGGRFRTLGEPEELLARLKGETLSVCLDGTGGIVAATTPTANVLSFWDMKSGRLLRHYDVENPRGVALSRDGRHFVLSYGKPPQVSLISTTSLEPEAGTDLIYTGMSGSHVLTYDRLPAVQA